MPYYQYTCSNCSHQFEKKLPMSEYNVPPTESCPNCDKMNTVTQDICAPAIVDPVRIGAKKIPSDFSKYVLGRIKENHPHGNVEKTRSIPKEI